MKERMLFFVPRKKEEKTEIPACFQTEIPAIADRSHARDGARFGGKIERTNYGVDKEFTEFFLN